MQNIQSILNGLILITALSAEAHECARPCVSGTKPKLCEYHFHVEWYVTMSKVGFQSILS